MFKKEKIKLSEASGLMDLITAVLNGVDTMPFKASHVFNRQLTKLKDVPEKINEARESSIISVVGEKKLEKAKQDGETKLTDIMTEKQLNEFQDLFSKELESEYEADLLTESFEKYFENAELPSSVGLALSGAIMFYEEKEVW